MFVSIAFMSSLCSFPSQTRVNGRIEYQFLQSDLTGSSQNWPVGTTGKIFAICDGLCSGRTFRLRLFCEINKKQNHSTYLPLQMLGLCKK